MAKPFTGEPVPFKDYFVKGNFRLHLIGILGGIIWNIGMSVNNIASGAAGPAIGDAAIRPAGLQGAAKAWAPKPSGVRGPAGPSGPTSAGSERLSQHPPEACGETSRRQTRTGSLVGEMCDEQRFRAERQSARTTFPARFPVIRVDHVFVSRDLCSANAFTFGVPGSDHEGLDVQVGVCA